MNNSTQFPTILRNLIFVLFLSLQAFQGFGQTFQTTIGYGLPTDERGVSGLITNAGEYLILGSSFQHPSGLYNASGDMELVRLDNLGNLILPSKMIGQDLGESGTWIEKATGCNGNNGYIIAGNEYGSNGNDMLLTFTNTAGTPLWVRRIGTPNEDETSACVKQDGAGNFILVGTKTNLNTGMSTIHAVKTDCAGTLIWERVYRANGSAKASSVTAFASDQSACNGLPKEYFITGRISSAAGNNEELFILSINISSGNVSWMNTYDVAPNTDDIATCIQGRCSGLTPNKGELWVSGYSQDGGNRRVLMMQTDITGNVQWANNYDVQNSKLETATHFQFAANDRLVLTGKAEETGQSDPPETGQCLLMRITENGSLVDWTRVFDMGFASQGNRVEPNSADQYFITGYSYDIIQPQQFDYNILAIKTNQQGETNSECFHSPQTEIILLQPVTTPTPIMALIPQDFSQASLDMLLFDDKQTFCPPVQIDPCDTLGLTANFSVTGVGNTLTFTDLSSPGSGSIFSWNWDFGDANTSGLQNPIHTYTSPGVYTVCLIISGGNAAGIVCRDTVCKDILVPFEQVDTCEGNILLNGDFTDGLVAGNLGSPGAVSNWATWTGSPQVVTSDNCKDPGAIQMWGNQVVGESIWQAVNFTAGGIYEVSLCGKWLNTVQGNVQIRFRASQGFPGSYLNCSGTCDEIFLSPVLNTSWSTYNSAPWTATQNYNTLTISIWNNFAVNDGAYVSWARIDDICIRRVGTTATHEVNGKVEAKLFPNPTSGDVNLEFGEGMEAETMIAVMDMTGRTLLQTIIEPGQMQETLSLSQYPAGIYVVRAIRDGRPVWMEKVIKE